MTQPTTNTIEFPFQPQPPGTPLSDAQLFWEWKMKAASCLNTYAERGIEPHDEVKETIREVNGYLVDLGYPPLIVDF